MSSVEVPVLTAQYGGFKIMGSCSKFLYWQGIWREDPDPDLEFYHQFFSPRLAHLLVKYPYLRLTLRIYRLSYIWSCLSYLVLTVLVLCPMGIISHWDQKSDVFLNCYMIAITGQLFAAVHCTTFHEYDYKNFAVAMEGILSRAGQMDTEERRMMDKAHVLSHNVTKCLHFVLVPFQAVIVFVVSIFYLRPNRMLYYRFWYPWDPTSQSYAFTLCEQSAALIFLFLMANTLVSSALCRFIHINTFFDILRNKIKHICVRSTKKTLKEIKDASQLSATSITSVQVLGLGVVGPALSGDGIRVGLNAGRIDNLPLLSPLYEPRNVLLVAERVIAASTVVEVGEDPVSLELEMETVGETMISDLEGITAEELDKEMQTRLAVVVKFHVSLVTQVNHIRSFLNTFLVVFFGTNVVLLGLSVLILLNGDLNGMIAVMFAVFSIEVTFTYFMYNFLGGMIADQNAAIRDEIYSMDWFEASPSFKKSMLIMMSRANVPVTVKPTGLDPMSLKNFSEVLKIAYKMISTLNTFAE